MAALEDTEPLPARDRWLAPIFRLLRPLTHPDGQITWWAYSLPDWLSYARFSTEITPTAALLLGLLGQSAAAWVCFALALVGQATDLLDGPWARCVSGVSEFGRLLDDTADTFVYYMYMWLAVVVSVAAHSWLIGGLAIMRIATEVIHLQLWVKPAWRMTGALERGGRVSDVGFPEFAWADRIYWSDCAMAYCLLLSQMPGVRTTHLASGFAYAGVTFLLLSIGLSSTTALLDRRFCMELKRRLVPDQ